MHQLMDNNNPALFQRWAVVHDPGPELGESRISELCLLLFVLATDRPTIYAVLIQNSSIRGDPVFAE